MHKIVTVKLILAIMLFNTYCSVSKPLPPNKQDVRIIKEDRLFRLQLSINKSNFKENEKIEVLTTLNYIGEEDKIQIWHGEPYINYSITGDNFSVSGITLTILKTTVLYKGEKYQFPYFKSGGYSATEADATFCKKFFAEENLYLPKGEYTITAICDFSLSGNIEKDRYKNEVQAKIVVR